ncbi:hypothetical protein [Streptomyces cavourensis]|uniref:hypothetical protein n=1 Tax=Streptomyces cavourensis TaxID=67258 RepID=UPI001F07A8C4|nr:hypothetical protein [Streptomyces cavourensis]
MAETASSSTSAASATRPSRQSTISSAAVVSGTAAAAARSGTPWARAYRAAREQYRAVPRATLISLDERVTPAEIHPARLLHTEEMLAFLCAIGLGLEDAVHVRRRFLQDVFAFTLLIDHRYDRSDESVRAMMQQPVPAPWLAAHPDLDVPYARAAAELPTLTGDAYFERVVDDAIVLIEHRIRR